MNWVISALIATMSFSVLANDSKPSEKEMGVIACVERSTKFGSDDDSNDKAQLVNSIFQEMGIGMIYDHSRHADSWIKLELTDSSAYSEGYSACDEYLYKVDPDGTKYANYD